MTMHCSACFVTHIVDVALLPLLLQYNPENALAYRGVDPQRFNYFVRQKPLTTLRPARATKNINSDSNYSTVNVVAAGRWPASSIFGPQQDPAVVFGGSQKARPGVTWNDSEYEIELQVQVGLTVAVTAQLECQ
jgi:hypothetical protein